MTIVNCSADLLQRISNYKVKTLTKDTFDRKSREMIHDVSNMMCLLEVRDQLQQMCDWKEAMAVIARNSPNERGLKITVLPNSDTFAALLAVRLGINRHLAVALAYDDMIEAWHFSDGDYCKPVIDPEEAVVLATFSQPGKWRPFVALAVRKDVMSFKIRYQPEELVLFDQSPVDGLFHPFSSDYFERHPVSELVHRTDQDVYSNSLNVDQIDLDESQMIRNFVGRFNINTSVEFEKSADASVIFSGREHSDIDVNH